MPNNRYIMVDIVIESIDFSKNPAEATYSGSSTPGGSNPNNPVVTSKGEINLNNVNKGNSSPIAVISFTLNPSTRSGFKGVTLTNASGGKAGDELAGAVTRDEIVILDLDTDGKAYNYCIWVSEEGMPEVSLDPRIVNRT
jgi:hypothetical protein